MTIASRTTPRVAVLCLAVAVASACGRSAPPPQPGQMRGFPPDMGGRRVILLPVQQVAGVRGDPSAEVAFALKENGPSVEWIDSDQVESALARSPGMDTRTRGLPVGQFLRAEVRRIGDPLYGELRRMAALVEADLILIPVAASLERNLEVVASVPRVRLTATVIEPRTGRVVWFGVEESGNYESDDPRALASAAENLARTLLSSTGDMGLDGSDTMKGLGN